jgi:hypothetical protein
LLARPFPARIPDAKKLSRIPGSIYPGDHDAKTEDDGKSGVLSIGAVDFASMLPKGHIEHYAAFTPRCGQESVYHVFLIIPLPV